MIQCGNLKCPICNKTFTKRDVKNEVLAVGHFDKNIHDTKYYDCKPDYKVWYETKCKNPKCKAIIVFREVA